MSEQRAPSYHIVLRAGPSDSFSVEPPAGALTVGLRMDGAAGSEKDQVDEEVWEPLRQAGVTPRQEAVDFLRFATAAYCADLLVPHETAFDEWSRHVVLHLPVSEPERWEAATDALTSLLDFLSGDRWELRFRGLRVGPPPRARPMRRPPPPIEATRVCLLSGGLDSAIGGADLLNAGHEVAFVSHNAKSGGAVFSSPAQDSVIDVLRRHTTAAIHPLRFRLHPPTPVEGVTTSVTTTRARSIIFFALGLLTASALDAAHGGDAVPLVVPENGLISLNVPLTKARLGSWSTRTTHPHTIALLRDATHRIGLVTPIETPYAGTTKGEMLLSVAARDRALAEKLIEVTVSCAHPNHSRYLAEEQRRPHCGTCVPCIIRRAAAQRAGVDDGRYTFDLPGALPELRDRDSDRASDPLAFMYALETRRRPARPLDIAKSGPLHALAADELGALLRVYDAGMDEVAHHLGVSIR